MSEENLSQAAATKLLNTPKTSSRKLHLLVLIIDALLANFLFVLLGIALFGGFPDRRPDIKINKEVIIVVVFLLILLVKNIYLLYKNAQTLGKVMCEIKNVRTNYLRTSLRRIIFIRNLPFLITHVSPFTGVIYFADTIVIDV